MRFEDLNEIDLLTHKADFIAKLTSSSLEEIEPAIVQFRNNTNLSFNEVFLICLKFVETRKKELSNELIETIFSCVFKTYNEDETYLNNYIKLLQSYVYEDVSEYNIVELYSDEFAKQASVYFNIMFASYYLNLLIERSNDMNEINRINDILKNAIVEFKSRTGRM